MKTNEIDKIKDIFLADKLISVQKEYIEYLKEHSGKLEQFVLLTKPYMGHSKEVINKGMKLRKKINELEQKVYAF